mmetsp:Transcript_25487/g.44865  ORF Transcript_25487/g.44865 Transcript_25487/m.44865 type:complete len:132 (+) Transcript_25487:552-947(+)
MQPVLVRGKAASSEQQLFCGLRDIFLLPKTRHATRILLLNLVPHYYVSFHDVAFMSTKVLPRPHLMLTVPVHYQGLEEIVSCSGDGLWRSFPPLYLYHVPPIQFCFGEHRTSTHHLTPQTPHIPSASWPRE